MDCHSHPSAADMVIVEPAKLDEEEDVKPQASKVEVVALHSRRALEQWNKNIVAQLKR